MNLLFGYVGLVTLVYGLLTAKFYRSWTIADWLINYEGGFVRRGLPGQVAFGLGQAFHLSPIVFVTLFYLVLYAVLLLMGRALALRAKPSWWTLALLLSPATFSFQVLDLTGGFRKEILYLAVLALLLASLQRDMMPSARIGILLTVAVCVEVLSHESLICYLPYLFAALFVTSGSLRKASRQLAVPALAGLLTAYLCLHHLGNVNTAKQICRSLGYTLEAQGKQICSGGAIGYLALSPTMARQRTWTYVRDDLYLVVYPLASALALIPMLLGSAALVRAGWRREVRVIWCAASTSFVCTLPLFVYAEDWGRWIYIHILSLALLLLYLNGRANTAAVNEIANPLPRQHRKILGWTLAAYATLWSLPHVPSRTLPFGYLGLVHYVLLYR